MAASHSPLLIALYQAMREARHGQVWGDLKRRSMTQQRRTLYQSDHHAIVAALSIRDSGQAVEAMRRHLARVQERLNVTDPAAGVSWQDQGEGCRRRRPGGNCGVEKRNRNYHRGLQPEHRGGHPGVGRRTVAELAVAVPAPAHRGAADGDPADRPGVLGVDGAPERGESADRDRSRDHTAESAVTELADGVVTQQLAVSAVATAQAVLPSLAIASTPLPRPIAATGISLSVVVPLPS